MNHNTEKIILTTITAMLLAQIIKFIIAAIVNKKTDGKILFSTGGMPSSHSALVTSLLVSIALFEGVYNTTFAVALVLSMVVIHDSIGVRYEASKHARSLNEIKMRLNIIENIEAEERKLKESLGHKPLEALIGSIFGAVIAITLWLILK